MQQPTMPDRHARWHGDEMFERLPTPGSGPLDEDDAHERWVEEQFNNMRWRDEEEDARA